LSQNLDEIAESVSKMRKPVALVNPNTPRHEITPVLFYVMKRAGFTSITVNNHDEIEEGVLAFMDVAVLIMPPWLN
jgi:hypothetical protein